MKVMVAARGEVAARVARAARELGWTVVAVREPGDPSPHHRAAHITVTVPSYTDMDSIVEAAQRLGVDIIHPGYGFLAESPEFAEKVLSAGISWAGPSPRAMRTLGDKEEAKRLAEKLGVPTPQWCRARSPGEAASCAEKLGAPVLLKASRAGGGRGLRVARSPQEAAKLYTLAEREAAAGFGEAGGIVIEKLVPRPRHVEVQVLGEPGGGVVHLYERECSIQRRRQKVVEEAPSPLAERNPRLRSLLLDYALRLAEAVEYQGPGTVEFIVSPGGQPYFIEANTRLQVEHGVTEMVTGVDIVKAQLLAAAGKPLGLRQEEIRLHGWAVEARIYAEDPAHGFAPSTGRVTRWRSPSGPWVRVDHAVEEGMRVTPRYDTLLAKVIAYGRTRPEALDRLALALRETVIDGVETNLDLLRVLAEADWLRAGELHTWRLEEELPRLLAEAEKRRAAAEAVARALAPITPARPAARAAVHSHGWPRPGWSWAWRPAQG